MKTLLQFSLFIILFTSCSKNNELTEIQYNGYGGISSKINGEVVKPKGGGIYGNTDCRIDSENGVPFFSVSYFNMNATIFKSIRIVAVNVPYENMTGQTYSLKSNRILKVMPNTI